MAGRILSVAPELMYVGRSSRAARTGECAPSPDFAAITHCMTEMMMPTETTVARDLTPRQIRDLEEIFRKAGRVSFARGLALFLDYLGRNPPQRASAPQLAARNRSHTDRR